METLVAILESNRCGFQDDISHWPSDALLVTVVAVDQFWFLGIGQDNHRILSKWHNVPQTRNCAIATVGMPIDTAVAVHAFCRLFGFATQVSHFPLTIAKNHLAKQANSNEREQQRQRERTD